MKIISWNIAHRSQPWYWLLKIDADLALLQEASEPPPEVAKHIEVNPDPWRTAGSDTYRPRRWRAAVVRLSDRVRVDWIESKPIAEAGPGELAVSRPGTLAVARVTPPNGEPFVVVSMYALWMSPYTATGSGWIVSDASAHHVVSDLSGFIGSEHDHRVLAAGDLNILRGYGEYGDAYWAARYQTVFTRMDALGLPFIGPQAPHGRQADPWPDELPMGSKNVPTYHSTRQKPAEATRQLDYVFASKSFAECVSVRALNEPEEWGPSDHCRLEIEVT